MSENSSEMSLQEVACQYGGTHGACKSYELIRNISVEMSDCSWWQFYRRYKLCKRFRKEMKRIEKMR